jgi:hypothetical protein
MSNNNGIQLWTVPVTGNYTIRAVGATGSNEKQTTVPVGNPADMTGTFSLIGGEVIKILVGQSGWLGAIRPGWGGGGGTFVVRSNNTPLIVAGGCGSGHDGNTVSGIGTRQNANTDISGMLESGIPGTWTNPSDGGGDGAGFDADGSIGNGIVNDGKISAVAAKSFKNGGVGASVGGGFGGGGSVTNTYGGGGGGYKGGQGGKGSPYNGGGGGSYNSGTNKTSKLYTNAMTTMSHGFVTITSTQITATLTVTASQTIFYRRFVSGASISFDISSNAGVVPRTHVSNNTAVVTIPTASTPSASIAGPGKTTIKVTQPATGNYTEVVNNALITIVVTGQGSTYTSETFPASFDMSGTNLSNSTFTDCTFTSTNLFGITVDASTNFSTSTFTDVGSGRIIGKTARLPVGFTMI